MSVMTDPDERKYAIMALAEAMASVDDRLKRFKYEQGVETGLRVVGDTGTYIGYKAEAEELVRRIEQRGFELKRRSS